MRPRVRSFANTGCFYCIGQTVLATRRQRRVSLPSLSKDVISRDHVKASMRENVAGKGGGGEVVGGKQTTQSKAGMTTLQTYLS